MNTNKIYVSGLRLVVAWWGVWAGCVFLFEQGHQDGWKFLAAALFSFGVALYGAWRYKRKQRHDTAALDSLKLLSLIAFYMVLSLLGMLVLIPVLGLWPYTWLERMFVWAPTGTVVILTVVLLATSIHNQIQKFREEWSSTPSNPKSR